MRTNLLCAFMALAACLALAGPAPAAAPMAQNPLFDLQKPLGGLDANADGKVDPDEFCAGAKDRAACLERFKQLDVNADGSITPHDLQKRFDSLDADGDGKVSRQEFMSGWRDSQYVAEHYQRLDIDGDGYITRDEFRSGWGAIPVWAW
ncbi:MAG: EF-hand domain-containing protein [Pseudomonadota bacterium]